MARNVRTARRDGQGEAGAAEKRPGVYRLAERLLDHVLDVTPNFPKDYRYTVGEAMQLRCLELLSRLSEAYRTFDRAGKSEALLKAITKVVVPNGAICPGWGDVTVSASTSSSTES